jgi:hypothetical protein
LEGITAPCIATIANAQRISDKLFYFYFHHLMLHNCRRVGTIIYDTHDVSFIEVSCFLAPISGLAIRRSSSLSLLPFATCWSLLFKFCY